VAFEIESFSGKTAIGILTRPFNSDTLTLEIHNISRELGKRISKTVDGEWEGVICSRVQKNNRTLYYVIQGNSVKLDEPEQEDTPEETVLFDGTEYITKAEFDVLFHNTTCCQCGMDLEFVDGHISVPKTNNVICAECVETIDHQQSMRNCAC
jgi:hypothetical protein